MSEVPGFYSHTVTSEPSWFISEPMVTVSEPIKLSKPLLNPRQAGRLEERERCLKILRGILETMVGNTDPWIEQAILEIEKG